MACRQRNNAKDTFHRFQQLPAEIRIAIWEHHFAQPRVHILGRRRGLSSRGSLSHDGGGHDDDEDAPLFTNTTRCVDPNPRVNYEASIVAASVWRRRRVPVLFARDLTAAAAQRGTTRRTSQLEADLDCPVSVDWATDLVCAGPGFADDDGGGGGGCTDALDRLRGHAWTGRIHRLGLHVGPRDLAQLLAVAAPCAEDDNGGAPLIAELPDLLADFASLGELRLLVGLPGAARSAWAARRSRDAFGFVPFDILAETRSRTEIRKEIKPWGSEDADLRVGGVGVGVEAGADVPLAFPSLAMRTLFPELEVLLRDFIGTRNRPVKLITAVDLDYAAWDLGG